MPKFLETLVYVKLYLASTSALSEFESGFRKKHSTTTSTMTVLNDIIEALDDKKCTAALFIDLQRRLILLTIMFWLRDGLHVVSQTRLLAGLKITV